jgi:uncharacterized coiled-coil protein SlyX
LALAQPHGSFLSTTNGQPVRHYTQWGELTPQSQQQLKQLEAMIIASREDSKLLDGVERLAEYQPVKKGTGKKGEAAARPSPGTTTNGKLTKGEIQRRELERAAKATGNRLKLLETQLWSDNDRLSGLTEAVVECLRDTEHAQARLQRLKDAHAADELARSHALAHPNQPPPPAAAPVYLPAPQRPSPYLQKTVEKLYATAEGFERGTLEMEHNLRTTGRVLGAGAGGGGQGMEALTAALHGHATSFPAIGTGGGEDGMEKFDGGVAALKALRASRTGGPAEHRAAVEAARRYFNKVGGDLAKLHERVSRAKSAHLAKLREKGDHRDPFAEAEKEEEEARRLAELAEQPQPAMALPAAGMYGQPGVPGQQLALPAPGAAGGLSLTTPGGTSLFGAPGAGGGLFGAASAPATGGGLFGAAPAPGDGRRSVRRSFLAGDWRRSVWRPRGDDAGCGRRWSVRRDRSRRRVVVCSARRSRRRVAVCSAPRRRPLPRPAEGSSARLPHRLRPRPAGSSVHPRRQPRRAAVDCSVRLSPPRVGDSSAARLSQLQAVACSARRSPRLAVACSARPSRRVGRARDSSGAPLRRRRRGSGRRLLPRRAVGSSAARALPSRVALAPPRRRRSVEPPPRRRRSVERLPWRLAGDCLGAPRPRREGSTEGSARARLEARRPRQTSGARLEGGDGN